ncbi:hypothetical protein BT63DRAFT_464179 [Microthyrium microscopicum]|uniref:Uncharacterized protein n=1 Tax=Microthyrium microscopicum TaxID=703497 RepID=A0A6A6TYZ5_9PEZI|nr:hypothetical protein BT63DRAFT_464179 [Microthyrium microscopicum]
MCIAIGFRNGIGPHNGRTFIRIAAFCDSHRTTGQACQLRYCDFYDTELVYEGEARPEQVSTNGAQGVPESSQATEGTSSSSDSSSDPDIMTNGNTNGFVRLQHRD